MVAHVLLPHVRSFAPDLIFSYFLYPDGFAALKIGKALGVPVVAMGVGSDVHNIRDRFSAIHTRTVLREADFLVPRRRRPARSSADAMFLSFIQQTVLRRGESCISIPTQRLWFT